MFKIKSYFKLIVINVIAETGKQAGGILNPKVLCQKKFEEKTMISKYVGYVMNSKIIL